MKIILLYVCILGASTVPAFAQDTVWLNVNQTHSLNWQWQNTEGPVRSFVFKCGQYIKEIVDADARSLRFGSLIDEPGQYSGCTLSAKNEAGESMPVKLPAFNYIYSYEALTRFILELVATLSAGVGVMAITVRHLIGWMPRRKQQSAPLALPEPIIIMEQAREHVRHF